MRNKVDKILGKYRERDASSIAWGAITGTLSSQTDLNTALSGKLSAASNLSDVADVSDARTNLGLGTAAEVNTGTTDGTIPVLDVTNKFDIAVIPDIPFANLSGLPGDNTALQTALDDKADVSSLGTLSTQNGTFSGGGTLATGGYTLTVPATGTAALLGTANTFTATQIVVVDQGNAEFQAFTYRDTPSAGFFRANKARGTLASPKVLQNGDLIGGFIGTGYTGSVFEASAQVSLVADGAMGSNRIPGRVELSTSDGTAGTTARMTIKNNGNVGIGTSSPTAKLNILGSYGSQLRIQNTETDNTSKGGTVNTAHYANATSPLTIIGGYSTSTANETYIGGGWSSGTASTQISFWTAANNTTTTGSERMRIDSSGNVGIGTTPAYKLDVSGVGNFTGGLRVDASQNSAFDALYFRNSNTGNAALTRASFRSDAGEQLIIDVFGSGYSGSISGINYANLVAIRARTNTSGLMIGTESTDPFYFITNNSVRATLDSSGNFGIGGSPTQKLHVIGTGDLSLRAENASYKLDFGVDSTSAFLQSRTAANAAAPLYLYTGSTAKMVIDSSGNVGIGTSSPNAKLNILGAFGSQLRIQDNATDNTAKGGTVNVSHYANATSPVMVVGGYSTASDNEVYLGGGWSSGTTATRISFWTAANNTTTTGTERMRIDSSGNVGIGTSTPAGKFDAVVDGNGGIFRRYGGSPSMQFARANGTLASPTQVNSATTIGAFGATALDNTGVYRTVALIRFNSEGAITSTSAPGSVSIQTTPSGSVTAVDRVTVTAAGLVGFGTTAPDKAVEINSATGANLRLTYNDSNGSAVNYVDFATTSSGDLTITPSGGDVNIVGNLTLSAKNLITDTTTGMKIGTATSQKIGLWNATPIVQPTTSVAAATFVAGAGTAVNDASTFDGYTLKQVVKALRNIGLLA